MTNLVKHEVEKALFENSGLCIFTVDSEGTSFSETAVEILSQTNLPFTVIVVPAGLDRIKKAVSTFHDSGAATEFLALLSGKHPNPVVDMKVGSGYTKATASDRGSSYASMDAVSSDRKTSRTRRIRIAQDYRRYGPGGYTAFIKWCETYKVPRALIQEFFSDHTARNNRFPDSSSRLTPGIGIEDLLGSVHDCVVEAVFGLERTVPRKLRKRLGIHLYAGVYDEEKRGLDSYVKASKPMLYADYVLDSLAKSIPIATYQSFRAARQATMRNFKPLPYSEMTF